MRAALVAGIVTITLACAGTVDSKTPPQATASATSSTAALPTGAVARPESLGPYTVYSLPDGSRLIATDAGPIGVEGDAWHDLLGAGTPAQVAALVVAARGRGMAFVVDPTSPEVKSLDPAQQELVTAPRVDGSDSRVLTVFIAEPPSMSVGRLRVTADATAVDIAYAGVHTLVGAATVDASALDAPEPKARREAAKALGAQGGGEALAALRARLDKEDDRQTIGALVGAIAKIDRSVLDELVASHANPVVQEFALSATLTP